MHTIVLSMGMHLKGLLLYDKFVCIVSTLLTNNYNTVYLCSCTIHKIHNIIYNLYTHACMHSHAYDAHRYMHTHMHACTHAHTDTHVCA